MASADEQVAAMLHNKGLRHTAPRVAVMRVLLEAACPLTHHQIAERLGSEAPNKTTIYRILMSLVETDLVHKVFVQERQWHFELAHHCSEHQCHPHFTCTRCQRTECLHDVAIPLVELPEGLTMQRQQIQIEGLCSHCKA
jgi:Fur family transcriptional regulator, ferric uptake regulator